MKINFFFLKILCYTVFIVKLQKLHVFKSSHLEMFYIMVFLKGVLKNFPKFTGKHKCWSLIRNNVASCCFCSLSGIYKDEIITHNPANLSSNSLLFCFLWQCSDLSLKILYCTYIVLISEVYSEPYQTSKMEIFFENS